MVRMSKKGIGWVTLITIALQFVLVASMLIGGHFGLSWEMIKWEAILFLIAVLLVLAIDFFK